MAYFDSPKNRAFWERELSALEKQRDEMRGMKAEQRAAAVATEEPSYRVRINFETLVQQEFGETALGRVKSVVPHQPMRQKERSL